MLALPLLVGDYELTAIGKGKGGEILFFCASVVRPVDLMPCGHTLFCRTLLHWNRILLGPYLGFFVSFVKYIKNVVSFI